MHLDERLDFAPPLESLRAHALGYLPWTTLDTSDDGMGIRALLSSIVDLLYHDDLLASLTALENDCNLSSLHESYGQERKRNGIPFPACRLKKGVNKYTTRDGHESSHL
jgi:hypothetical protein